MKSFAMLALFLSVVKADITDGACGPKPPTVQEFDKERVGAQFMRSKHVIVRSKSIFGLKPHNIDMFVLLFSATWFPRRLFLFITKR